MLVAAFSSLLTSVIMKIGTCIISRSVSTNKNILHNNTKTLGVELHSGNIFTPFLRVGDVHCFIKRVFSISHYYNNNG